VTDRNPQGSERERQPQRDQSDRSGENPQNPGNKQGNQNPGQKPGVDREPSGQPGKEPYRDPSGSQADQADPAEIEEPQPESGEV
jgi:hypothetical protein